MYRGPHHEREARRKEILAEIRRSRHPQDLINSVVDEAVCRGGFYGLELAADLLGGVPGLLGTAIDSYFHRDARRRERDRAVGFPRYGTADEAWGVFLQALAQTPPEAVRTERILATLRRVQHSATDGMVGGLVIAAKELADSRPEDAGQAEAFIMAILDSPDLSESSRRVAADTLSDLRESRAPHA